MIEYSKNKIIDELLKQGDEIEKIYQRLLIQIV